MQAIFEECWFEWHKTLKLVQVNGPLKQLPVWIIRKVSENELRRRRHEVVLIQLVANIFRRCLLVCLTQTVFTQRKNHILI